jgi:CubicO group peptidase (beta-lactamase class C family)
MKHTLILALVFFINSFNTAGAFEQPSAEEYFQVWIKDYQSIVEGRGPIPVEYIENKKPKEPLVGNKKNYDRFFKETNNQSAIVFKNNELVYETYNNKWYGSKSNLIHGQSMTKTVTGLTVGALICSGQISSINDPLGKYSPTLVDTPYNQVTIKQALQMRSGVSKYDPEGTWDIWWMVTGDKERGYAGKNYLKNYIKTIKSAEGDGKISEYHPHESHVLSIMVSDLTSKSLGRNFYDLVFSKLKVSGDFVWMTDADGVTVPTSGLFLQARDWATIGSFMGQSINKNDCMGKFLQNGVNEASESSRLKGWKYGYHFWTHKGLIIFAGFGGQTMYVNAENQSVVMASSVNPKYGNSSVFGIAGEVVLE